jgi:cysteine synthase A
MIHDSIADLVGGTPLVRLSRLFPNRSVDVLAKLEYLNPLGSTKDRVARFVIQRVTQRGLLVPGGEVVESSSGNFGIALAALAPLYGLSVTCVVDPIVTGPNLTILKGLGARVEMVDQPDEHGGYLHTRLRRVQEIVRDRTNALWINQYANDLCWQAHYESTATEILKQVECPVDVLVVAVSTTATLLGTARGLREHWPQLKVVAVDAVGSVVFGGVGSARRLPGLGSSRTPELLRRDEIDEVLHVTEEDAITGCRSLLAVEGILAGASSGALVSALKRITPAMSAGTSLLTLLPDRGERYLDLVFDDNPAFAGEPMMAASGRRSR